MGGSPRLVSQTTVLAVLLLGALCAVSQSAATGRSPPPPIIEGEPAAAGAYPAHGFLQAQVASARPRGCGGTLVGTRHFLTAAHCAVDESDVALPADRLHVLLGDANLAPPNVDWYGVTALDIHPGFHELRNDVALLKLDRPALVYVPLPVIGSDQASVWAPGTMARIIGWGRTESGSTSSVLLEAAVPIVSDANCVGAYSSGLFDAETMVCAGDGVHDTCQGDSGGPLMAWDGYAFVLVGITSWGFACAQPGYPGVYTRLGASALNSWVHMRFPRASFTYAREPGAGPTLKLSSTSFHPESGGFTSFAWDFDADGQFDDGTGETVVHGFPAEGTYEVSLEASKPGADRAVATRDVSTSGVPPPPPPPGPPPQPPPPQPPPHVPPCPPGDVPPGATYRGTHSGGGNFCLTLTADFSGVTGFVAYNVAGDTCRFDWSQTKYSPPLPIVNYGFSQSGNANLSGYFGTDRAGRSVLNGTFSLFSPGLRPCFSGYMNWSGATDATPPWVAPPPPPFPLPRAQVVRCRVPKVIGRKLPAARSRIRTRNCRIGKIVRKRSKKVGLVIGQKPRAGAVRARDFRITLTIGRR